LGKGARAPGKTWKPTCIDAEWLHPGTGAGCAKGMTIRTRTQYRLRDRRRKLPLVPASRGEENPA